MTRQALNAKARGQRFKWRKINGDGCRHTHTHNIHTYTQTHTYTIVYNEATKEWKILSDVSINVLLRSLVFFSSIIPSVIFGILNSDEISNAIYILSLPYNILDVGEILSAEMIVFVVVVV